MATSRKNSRKQPPKQARNNEDDDYEDDRNVGQSTTKKRRSGRAQKKASIHPDFIADFGDEDCGGAIDGIQSQNNLMKGRKQTPARPKKPKRVMDDFIVNDDEVDESGSLTETEESDIGQYDGLDDRMFLEQLDGTKRSRRNDDSSDDAGAQIDDDGDPEFDIGHYVEKKKLKTSKHRNPTTTMSNKKQALYEDEEDDDEDFDSGPHSSEDETSDDDVSDQSQCSNFSDYEGEKKIKNKKSKSTKPTKPKSPKKASRQSKSKENMPGTSAVVSTDASNGIFVAKTLKEKKKLWREMKKCGFSREERKKYFHLQKKQEKRMAKGIDNSPSKKKPMKRIADGQDDDPSPNKNTLNNKPIQQPSMKKPRLADDQTADLPDGAIIFPSIRSAPKPSPKKVTPQTTTSNVNQPKQEQPKFKSVQIVRSANGIVKVVQQPSKPQAATLQQQPQQPKTITLAQARSFVPQTSSVNKDIAAKKITITRAPPLALTTTSVKQPAASDSNLKTVRFNNEVKLTTLPKDEGQNQSSLPSTNNDPNPQDAGYDDEEEEKKVAHRPSILRRKAKPLPNTNLNPSLDTVPVIEKENQNTNTSAIPKKVLPTISIQNAASLADPSSVTKNPPKIVGKSTNLTFSLPNGLSVKIAKPPTMTSGILTNTNNNIAADIATATAKKMFTIQRMPGVVRQFNSNSVIIPNLRLPAGMKIAQPALPTRPRQPLVLDASHDIEIDKIIADLEDVDTDLIRLRKELEEAEDKLNKARENLHNEQLRMEEATKGTSQPYSLNKSNWKKYSNLRWPEKKMSKNAVKDIETLSVIIPQTIPRNNSYSRVSPDGTKSWSLFGLSPRNLRPLILSAGRKEIFRYEAEKKRVTQAIWPYPSARPCMAESWRFNLTRLTGTQDRGNFLYEIGVICNHLRVLWSNIRWVDVLYDPIEVLLDPPANQDHCPIAVDHKGILYSRQPSDINECFILRRIIEVEPLDKHWLMCNFLLRTESFKNVVHTIDVEDIGEYFQKISQGRFFKRRRRQFKQDLEKLGLGPKKRGRKPGQQQKKEAADPDYDPDFDDFDEVKPGKKGRGRPKKKPKKSEKESEADEKDSSDDSCDPYEDIDEFDPNYIPSLEEMDEIMPSLATMIMEDGENRITGHGVSSTMDDWIAEEGLLLWEVRYLIDCFFSSIDNNNTLSEVVHASRLTGEKDWPIILPKQGDESKTTKSKVEEAEDEHKQPMDTSNTNNISGESNKENEDEEDVKDVKTTPVKKNNNTSLTNHQEETCKKEEEKVVGEKTPDKMMHIVELLKKELLVSGLCERAKFCLKNGLIQSCIKPPPSEEQLKMLKRKEEKIKKMIEKRLPEIPTPPDVDVNESMNDSTHLLNNKTASEQKKRISSLINNNDEKKQSASQSAKVSAMIKRAKAVKTNIDNRSTYFRDIYLERRNLTENIYRLMAEDEYADHREKKQAEEDKKEKAKANHVTSNSKTPKDNKKATATSSKRIKKETPLTKRPTKKSTTTPQEDDDELQELSDASETIIETGIKPLVSSRRGLLTPSSKLKGSVKKTPSTRKVKAKDDPTSTPTLGKRKPSTKSTKKDHKVPEKPLVLGNTEHEDPNKLYCLCRTPYDYSAKYIGCDICLDWFHFECVNMDDEKMKDLGESWQCPNCVEVDNRLYCSCKKPYDKDRVYIGCDSCDDWYHPECVGLTDEEAKETDVYICPSCKQSKLEEAPEGFSIVDLNESVRSIPDKLVDRFKLEGPLLDKTNEFLEKLKNHPMSWPFIKPYDESKYPINILKTILSPMDIETILSTQSTGGYASLLEISRDLNLIFQNSKLAHLDEAPETKCANLLEMFVEKEIAILRKIPVNP